MNTLPGYLTQDEIRKMLTVTKNTMHLCILNLLYDCGLRLSELIKLKICDINDSPPSLETKSAKGKKDRSVVLPLSLLSELRQYYTQYRPKVYLFQGHKEKYSALSVQLLVKKAVA